MKKTFRTLCLIFVLLNFFACTQPPAKSEGALPLQATILGPADEPASAPQSIRVQGKFELGRLEKPDPADADKLLNFIISQVVSVSSSLTQTVGWGDTLRVRISHDNILLIQADKKDSSIFYQLILQEKLMMGKEGVIYSVKDIQRLHHSK